jgi:PhnB protein
MSTPNYPPLISYLAVNDGAKAIEFYKAAFGATELYRLCDSASGQIGHAELEVNGSVIMLSDEFPGFNKTPQSLGGTPVKFCLMVENADKAFDRAVAAGAEVMRPMTDEFYGYRCGSLRDPFGHEWMVQHEIEKVSPEEMQKRWDAMAKECQGAGEEAK